MPWCPNCHAEYQDGFTVCSDCKVDLVESLEVKATDFVPFFQAEDKKIADKLVRYFKYSDLESEVSYNEENDIYIVSIPPKTEKQASRLYQAFYFVERENIAKGMFNEMKEEETASPSEELDSSRDDEESMEVQKPLQEAVTKSVKEDDLNAPSQDEENDWMYETEAEISQDEDAAAPEITDEEFTGIEAEEDTSTYVMKADKYKDLAGTVWIFLFFGVAGLVFVILNVVGVLTVLNGWLPNTVMIALFLFFLYVAQSTNQKAKKVQAEIDTENKLTEEMNEWMKLHVTSEFLATLHNDNISEELNYIKLTDTVKELLLEEFGPQNLAYLDRLIEDYYNGNFEQ